MNKLNIHKRLKQARSFLKLNQTDVANDLDIQQKSISDIENGKILNIPNSYIYYFYNKGISLEWIYGNVGSMTRTDELSKSKIVNTESKKSEENRVEEASETQSKKVYPTNNNKQDKQEFTGKDTPIYDRIIYAKDDTISNMQNFINLQENHIDFLKDLVNKLLHKRD